MDYEYWPRPLLLMLLRSFIQLILQQVFSPALWSSAIGLSLVFLMIVAMVESESYW